MIEYLRHGRIRLALHRYKEGPGLPLLLLHGLGECAPSTLPSEYVAWTGPVFALDFTGHGKSDVPTGGGYSSEFLMADADVALAYLGPASIVGRGIGAYVALLLAGARPEFVRGAILRDGPGLAGGGNGTNSPYIPAVDTTRSVPPDPYAIVELATDVRPPAYAVNYAMLAMQRSECERPISVCTCERPDWLSAVMSALSLERIPLADALREYAIAPIEPAP